MKKRFRSGVNIHRTRSFPGADIGSDHDLVMMTFQVRLKMARKRNQPRLRFDLEKLRNPDVACTFQATTGGRFAPLIGLSDEDMDMDTMITTYNTAVTAAASEIPSFAMDTAHNFGPEFRSEKPVRVLHENKISRIFFPHPANVLIASYDDKHTGYIDSMFSCFGKNLKTGGIILILISSTVCLKY